MESRPNTPHQHVVGITWGDCDPANSKQPPPAEIRHIIERELLANPVS